MSADHLIIFVKAPRPGLVKTRLAAVIGADTACDAYLALVDMLLFRLAELGHVELKFAPADAVEEIKPWLRDGWRASPQVEGGLGDKLIGAFDEAFASGEERVVIIGSDCPYITQQDCEQAFAALMENDVVLGPATDGGYWLVGLSRSHPALFRGINWSTETVLAETLAAARGNGLNVKLLRELSDVDTVGDLAGFHDWHAREMSASSPGGPGSET